ncbi:MAG TPA: sigma-70 family RNA polymerase sigma factor [Ktedonobacteraceae bacterium]|jgi:RNA polymerase sigma-70 factor (ECF subfamily)|nr:sigma-70 family RNA polymerase sigma factor [Ktedonobacteraceae bacterium]
MFSWRRTSGSSDPDTGKRASAFTRLLDSARQGESEALSTLYREFLPGVFGYVATRVPDRATAEDLTSEVFLKMVEGIGQLRTGDEAGFVAWILQIARITVAGFYRKREKLPAHVPLESTSGDNEGDTENMPISASHPDSDPVRWTEARDEWNTTVKAMNKLTEEQRQVLVGRLLLGYDVATVARMLGKNENAIKALQFRALHSLHRFLQKDVSPGETSPIETQNRGGVR